jgi:hypothetical protein
MNEQRNGTVCSKYSEYWDLEMNKQRARGRYGDAADMVGREVLDLMFRVLLKLRHQNHFLILLFNFLGNQPIILSSRITQFL